MAVRFCQVVPKFLVKHVEFEEAYTIKKSKREAINEL